MKKLIFLLLMAVVLAGFVSAGAAHPPGVIILTHEVNYIEAALSGDSIDGYVVTPDTVLVMVMPVVAGLSSTQAVMVHNNFIAIQPQSGFIIESMSTELRRSYTGYTAADHYLRL